MPSCCASCSLSPTCASGGSVNIIRHGAVFFPGHHLDADGVNSALSAFLRVSPSGERKIDGSDLLVAAGRIPNTNGIGLEEAGVALDARGYIRVNERLETTAANVWAMGDCAGSPQFTHVVGDDFRIVRDNLAGEKRSTRDQLVCAR